MGGGRRGASRCACTWTRTRRTIGKKRTDPPLRHCEEPEGRRSNPGVAAAACVALDCFAEPVIGPATAGRTRWLAMTPVHWPQPQSPAEMPHHVGGEHVHVAAVGAITLHSHTCNNA